MLTQSVGDICIRHVAETRVVQRFVRMQVDWFLRLDGEQLGERLVDEDDGDKHREALLGETSDVANEGAQVERDHYQQEETEPHANPEAKLEVHEIVLPAIQ